MSKINEKFKKCIKKEDKKLKIKKRINLSIKFPQIENNNWKQWLQGVEILKLYRVLNINGALLENQIKIRILYHEC